MRVLILTIHHKDQTKQQTQRGLPGANCLNDPIKACGACKAIDQRRTIEQHARRQCTQGNYCLPLLSALRLQACGTACDFLHHHET